MTTTTIHLTHTGPNAGSPFCAIDRHVAAHAGHTFAHVPYSNAVAFLARPEICPACLREWELAAPEGDDAVEHAEADGSPLGTRYTLDPGEAEVCAPHAFAWSEQYQEYSCGKCGETRAREDAELPADAPDFEVTWHGSLVLVTPATPEADAHLRAHVDAEAQWFGGALAVEPRFLDDLVAGLQDAGYTVTGVSL